MMGLALLCGFFLMYVPFAIAVFILSSKRH